MPLSVWPSTGARSMSRPRAVRAAIGLRQTFDGGLIWLTLITCTATGLGERGGRRACYTVRGCG
jgi:hypothetical protein